MKEISHKVRDYEIGKDDDPLAREKDYIPLTNSLANVRTPYVLALDAPWGCGKTTFLKMWQSHLEGNGFGCVYFDAWKSDFYGDALPALIAETERELNPESKSELAEAGRKLGEFGDMVTSRQFITRVFGSLAESVPGGKVVKDSVQAALESLEPHNAVRNYLNYREAVDEFKKSLGDFVKEKKGNKPLIFFIDELDRCRPIFAIEVLEKVKHVFDAEGVVFVVGVHKAALAKTVEKIYGYDDGEIYLRKFFDDTHTLINARSIVRSAISRMDIPEMNPEIRDFFESYVSELCEMFKIAPRDTEQFTGKIFAWAGTKSFETAYLTADQNSKQRHFNENMAYHCIFPYLASIKYYDPALHQKIVASKNNLTSDFPWKEIIDPLVKIVTHLKSQSKYGDKKHVPFGNACGMLGIAALHLNAITLQELANLRPDDVLEYNTYRLLNYFREGPYTDRIKQSCVESVTRILNEI